MEDCVVVEQCRSQCSSSTAGIITKEKQRNGSSAVVFKGTQWITKGSNSAVLAMRMERSNQLSIGMHCGSILPFVSSLRICSHTIRASVS
mmetsp:Transcript_4323/g.9343  ORF Transcript_4323/g.9343 Transcript_4323/m.9343 type:complete len:90 (+) Transcript_4323:148-417(+)